jgi:hypothetical protein
VSVNAYIGKKSPACSPLTKLPPLKKWDVTDTNELPFWGPRSTGFPCIASDTVPAFKRFLGGDDLTVQNFKCFFPAVTINFASDEKLTEETAEQDELALSLVINIPLRQFQRYMYPPTDTRCFPLKENSNSLKGGTIKEIWKT